MRIRKQTTWIEIGVLWGVYLVTIAIPPTVATVNYVRFQWEQGSQSRAAQWLGLSGEGGNRGNGAAVSGSYASPINGTVSEIRKIGTSANGVSYQVHSQGKDWAGSVEHQLVHVDSIMVRQGETVAAGQEVAKVSPTDNVSTGPHLDWKIRRNGQWENPQKWAEQALSMGDAGDFVPSYVDAISRKESGHNYSAVNPDSGALGKFQFIPSTMGSTAKGCIGRTPSTSEFLGSPELQNQIMSCYVEGKLSTIQAKASDAYTQCRMMASIHYSGSADNYNNGKRQFYNGREYPSIADYTKDVCKGF